MGNVFTQVTRTGYGGRLKEAIGGVVVGLLMFFAAFPLQWWNEGRAVARSDALAEGASTLVSATAERVDPAYEGRLVHLAGRVEANAPLVDEDFGVSLGALGLEREVEMYQWREKRDTKERKTLGGGTEKVTEYRYELRWDDSPIDSSRFRHPEGHENPGAFPLKSKRTVAPSARLGAYTLDAAVLGELDDWRRLDPPQGEAVDAAGFVRNGDVLFRGADPREPQPGDLRVQFRHIPEGVHSFVAMQQGAGLAEYTTRGGQPLLLVASGAQPAEKMFASAQRANEVTTWVLRGAGLALMWLGLFMVMRPLAVVFDVVPLLGTIVSKGVGFVAFVLAAMFSLLTIAIAWIRFRPLLGIALLALAAVAVVLLRRRRAGALPPPAPTIPPPPPSAQLAGAVPPPPPSP